MSDINSKRGAAPEPAIKQGPETQQQAHKADGESTFSLAVPKNIWKWDVFGGSLFIVGLPYEVSIWRRILTRIFLGSKWKRINDQKS